MNLTISRCSHCNKTRLVDKVSGRMICLACKQKINRALKEKMIEPISA